MNIVMLNSILD